MTFRQRHVAIFKCEVILSSDPWQIFEIGGIANFRPRQRPNNLHEQFAILKKYHGKFECLFMKKETDFEHSKRLHSSETVHLII